MKAKFVGNGDVYVENGIQFGRCKNGKAFYNGDRQKRSKMNEQKCSLCIIEGIIEKPMEHMIFD